MNEVLKAKDSLADAVGVNTHHDAVTGTGKDEVAADYIRRIQKAINETNPVYGKMMTEMLASELDFKLRTVKWFWCKDLKLSYQDCPTGDYPDTDMLVATHNPSSIDQKYIRLRVQHGHYQVLWWNST